MVIGAGAVGIPLAVTLARRGLRVTLLEGGPAEPPTGHEAANAGPSTGRAYDGLVSGRMKALGGTTRLWGGQLVPFSVSDIEQAAFPGQPHWPFTHADYLGHVGQVYDLLGIPQDARDPRAVWSRMSGAEAAFGPSLEVGMNLWLPQPDFARLFAAELSAAEGPMVITEAEVERLEFGHPGRLDAVHTSRGSFRADRVVLACGTIEIARLLLRAAACEPACGFAGNEHLGKWFMDHLHGFMGELHGADPEAIGNLFDYVHHRGLRFGVKLRLSDDARAEQGLCNGVVTLNPRMGLKQGATELLALLTRLFSGRGSPAATLRHGLAMVRITLPLAWRYLVRRRSSLLFSSGVAIGVEFEQLPSPQSYIFLDPAEPPATAKAGICWNPGGEEMRTVQALAQMLSAELTARGLGEVRIDPRALAGDPAFLDACHDAYHQMGGARLAASASEGVVDHDLRVFGTDNLFVAGAAVFPSGSFANPTLTALALTLRLADHLSGAGAAR
nr:FAD-dependent oxidoreductase [Novosphingobium flavum]